jgi:hypothetical protein
MIKDKIDWKSKRKVKIKNVNGEIEEKVIFPAFIYGVISIRRVNHFFTEIQQIMSNY